MDALVSQLERLWPFLIVAAPGLFAIWRQMQTSRAADRRDRIDLVRIAQEAAGGRAAKEWPPRRPVPVPFYRAPPLSPGGPSKAVVKAPSGRQRAGAGSSSSLLRRRGRPAMDQACERPRQMAPVALPTVRWPGDGASVVGPLRAAGEASKLSIGRNGDLDGAWRMSLLLAGC
ncbi:hypothetical protein [Phenylobacterium deserti]|uniref:Uncharacterized protein n=1 Tax=Phenylobacterium deserti TaxID=1914756 RepID=A0A328AHC6_9CAUL|nr:hypothetical protein [Phenylobacterium deserti]RAK52764.1 hypothetical protein DJ018_11285 [Phenylobacterium deserti]